jgi:hypothetical protein
MRSWHSLAVMCVLLGSSAAMAEGPILRFWRDMCRSTARNNAWPDPFIPDDRCAVRAPLEIVAANGWRYNNILTDHHFDAAGRLNEAGDRMVRTTLREYPSGRRILYVVEADDAVVNEARVASTYEAASRYVLPGDVPQIGQTTIRPEGWPASFVVAVDRSFEENMPQPMLPPRSTAAGGAAGT